MTLDRCVSSIRHWVNRDDEKCLVFDVDGPKGFITYRLGAYAVCVVDNICVHPDHRRMGYGRRMMLELRELLVAQGVVVAEFDSFPSPIADKVLKGDFEKVSEGVRSHGHGNSTGLPLVTGRVTLDTVL